MSARTPNHRPRRVRHRPLVEPLEARRLLAITASVVYGPDGGGAVAVKGQTDANAFVVADIGATGSDYQVVQAAANGVYAVDFVAGFGLTPVRLTEVIAGKALDSTVLSVNRPDRYPPSIFVNSTLFTPVTHGQETLVGAVADYGTGVASLWAVEDQATPVRAPFTVTPVPFTQTGFFSYTTSVPLDGSGDGAHVIYFLAFDKAGNYTLSSVYVFTMAAQPITITPVGTLTATPGKQLVVPLSANDPSGLPVNFSVQASATLPISSLQGSSLVVAPSPDQVGTYHFNLVASDGERQSTAPVTLNVVADPVKSTRVSGVIENTSGQKLAGVPIVVGTVKTTTAADGSFLLDFGNNPPPADRIQVQGTQITGPVSYPFIAEKLALLLNHDVYSGVNNVIARPIFLPPLDTSNAKTIDPTRDTTVTTAAIPGAAVLVAAGTLKDQQGNPFAGKLSITQVPTDLTPAALPTDLKPDLVVTIQPGDMVFTKPAPLDLPNTAGWAPGTMMNLWSINPTTGFFDNVGTGQVSADGKVIHDLTGGVHNSSWHFYSNMPPTPAPPLTDDSPCSCCPATGQLNSQANLDTGKVTEDHSLASYQSLGVSHALTLHYDSLSADPLQIVRFGYGDVNPNIFSVPSALKLVGRMTINLNGAQWTVPGFVKPATSGNSFGLQGGEHFWSIAAGGGPLDAPFEVDLTAQPTGVYAYALTSGLLGFTGSRFIGSTSTFNGDLVNINRMNSPYGSGWGIDGLQQVIPGADGTALLVDGNGTTLLFQAPAGGGGAYGSPPGDFSTLVKTAGGVFQRTEKDGTVSLFDAQGRLSSVTDRNGDVTRYAYFTSGPASGALQSITDPVGLVTKLDYDAAGHLSTITDPAGRMTHFMFDAQGNLAQITDPNGAQNTYLYDAQHHEISHTDPLGRIGYDSYDATGRATGATLADGSKITLVPSQIKNIALYLQSVDPASTPGSNRAGRQATYTDGNGNTYTDTLDAAGQLVTRTDAVGPGPAVQRNSLNLITKVTDARGNATQFSYDARGNVTQVQDAVSLQTASAKHYTYDPTFNQVTGFTDELGHQTVYDIDPANGNIRSVRQVVGTGGANDVVTRYTYTPRGLVATVTDPLGRVTKYDYGPLGRLLQITLAAGTADQGVRKFGYDVAGNVATVTDENGHQTINGYDPMNRLTSVVKPNPDGSATPGPKTIYRYDAAGNLFSQTDPLGHTTVYTYDALNRRTVTRDPMGNPTTTAYDHAGNVLSVTDPLNHTTVYTYDARNRKKSVTDPTMAVTAFGYDADNDLTSVTDPDNNTTSYLYDARNRTTLTVSPPGNAIRYLYDSADNLVERQVYPASLSSLSYSDFASLGGLKLNGSTAGINQKPVVLGGQTVLRLTDRFGQAGSAFATQPLPLGSTSANPTFDASFAFQITSSGGAGDGDGPGGDGFTFVLVGQPNQLGSGGAGIGYGGITPSLAVEFDTYNNGGIDQNSGNHVGIDVNGNVASVALTPVAVRFNDGAVWHAWVDYNGATLEVRVSQTTVRPDKPTLTASIDLKGIFAGSTSIFAGFTSGTASATGDHDIRSWSMTYDALGPPGRKTDYNYDTLNRQTTESWVAADGTTTLNTIRYGYDPASNLTSLKDASSALAYAYDNRDRVKTVDNAGTPGAPHVVLAYAYDPAGNALSAVDAVNGQVGGISLYAMDALNRVTRITQTGAGVQAKRVDFGYNAVGQFTSLQRYSDLGAANLVASTSYGYDPLNRLTSLSHQNAAGTPLDFNTISYDAASRITKLIDKDGTATYGYDKADQLAAATYSNPTIPGEAYAYDPNGNRTSSSVHGSGYKTGPGNQLLSDGTYNYTYDNEGNLISRAEIATGKVRLFAWDNRNRLASVTDKTASGTVTQTVTYTYDALDRRISESVRTASGTTTTYFAYDGANVLLEFQKPSGSSTPALTERNLFGPAVDQILAQDNGAGKVAWMLADYLGSVRDVVNSGGNITDHLVYDTYGKLVSQTNPSATPRYQFTGREFDTATGLNYYRARYYDGALGRFVSEDPIRFNNGEYNAYAYVRANPVGRIDPSGLVIVKPGGIVFHPSSGPNPLDPAGLNTVDPTATEQQQIADVINQFLQGDVSGLRPHPYKNFPDSNTGAQLPQCTSGYGTLTIVDSNGNPGVQRVIIGGDGSVFYTNNHYRSFRQIDFVPESP
jgi:RHS repeat-associated protein